MGDRTFGAAQDEDRVQSTSWGSGSGASSSHMPASSASLALGRAHRPIQGIGSVSQSSIELVLGQVAQPGHPLSRAPYT